MAPELLVPYCPSCSAPIDGPTEYLERARDAATTHARITGHVVQIATRDPWRAVETISGEPSLPLWD